MKIALAWPALGLSVLLAVGCSRGGTRDPDFYDGCSSDENRVLFDDYESSGRVQSDPSLSPKWNLPASGASLPRATPPMFAWQPSAGDPGRPNGSASCPGQCPTCSTAALAPRHLPPVSGNAFDLHFRAGSEEIYRVITTFQQFTPSADVYASWAGKEIVVDLIGTSLLRNEAVQGPFRAAALTFTVQP